MIMNRRKEDNHRRAGENGMQRVLPKIEWSLTLGGLINTLLAAGILGVLAWGSNAISVLNSNKQSIDKLSEVQARVVATQGKVVETLVEIRTSLAVMQERDAEFSRRLNRIEGRVQ